MAGYTYTTLRQAILDFTDNEGEPVFEANIDEFIRNAEDRILQSAPLEIFRKSMTTTMTGGDKFLSKPNDWLHSFSMSILDSGEHKFLQNKDPNFLQDFWPDPADTDIPRYYADYDVTTFLVAPTPDSAYAVELQYFYRPESITEAAGGETWIGTNVGPALLYASLVEAYTFMKGMQDMLDRYEAMFEKSMARVAAFAVEVEGVDLYKVPSA